MANALTTPQSQQEVDPFERYGEQVASRAHIVGNLLRYTKHGDWKFGQDQEEMAEGTRMLVYMPSLKAGFVKWWEGKPVRHVIGLVGDGYEPPPRDELGDLDESEWGELNGNPIDPWQPTNYLIMCDEAGEMYTFVTSSKGGLSVVGELAIKYGKRRRMQPDEIPVIELHGRSYNHKDYGETFAPILKVTSWVKIPDNFKELASAIDGGGEEPILIETTATPQAASRSPRPSSSEPTSAKSTTKPSAKTTAKLGARGAKKGVRF